jgi:hypothetical protein
MVESWRSLVCAAALTVSVGIDVANAQTVIVTNAAPQSKFELVFNADTVGSTSVATGGTATIAAGFLTKAGKKETSAHVFVDACTNLIRVLFVEVGLPASGGCTRKEIAGLFVVRPVTTFVIDVGRVDPVIWLRQGPAPPEWLGPTSESGEPRESTWGSPPIKLVVFGGAGLAQFGDAVSSVCGDVANCSGNNSLLSYRAGAAYWIKPFLAAEVSYLKPKELTVNGTGTGFNFQSHLKTQMVTVAGNVGVPFGRARLYGQAGANYLRATSTTTETIDAAGTQTFTFKTEGWGWLFGGGAEVWMTHRVGIYGEFGLAQLKGTAVEGGQGAINDHITFVIVGGRIHIGR